MNILQIPVMFYSIYTIMLAFSLNSTENEYSGITSDSLVFILIIVFSFCLFLIILFGDCIFVKEPRYSQNSSLRMHSSVHIKEIFYTVLIVVLKEVLSSSSFLLVYLCISGYFVYSFMYYLPCLAFYNNLANIQL